MDSVDFFGPKDLPVDGRSPEIEIRQPRRKNRGGTCCPTKDSGSDLVRH